MESDCRMFTSVARVHELLRDADGATFGRQSKHPAIRRDHDGSERETRLDRENRRLPFDVAVVFMGAGMKILFEIMGWSALAWMAFGAIVLVTVQAAVEILGVRL